MERGPRNGKGCVFPHKLPPSWKLLTLLHPLQLCLVSLASRHDQGQSRQFHQACLDSVTVMAAVHGSHSLISLVPSRTHRCLKPLGLYFSRICILGLELNPMALGPIMDTHPQAQPQTNPILTLALGPVWSWKAQPSMAPALCHNGLLALT